MAGRFSQDALDAVVTAGCSEQGRHPVIPFLQSRPWVRRICEDENGVGCAYRKFRTQRHAVSRVTALPLYVSGPPDKHQGAPACAAAALACVDLRMARTEEVGEYAAGLAGMTS